MSRPATSSVALSSATRAGVSYSPRHPLPPWSADPSRTRSRSALVAGVHRRFPGRWPTGARSGSRLQAAKGRAALVRSGRFQPPRRPGGGPHAVGGAAVFRPARTGPGQTPWVGHEALEVRALQSSALASVAGPWGPNPGGLGQTLSPCHCAKGCPGEFSGSRAVPPALGACVVALPETHLTGESPRASRRICALSALNPIPCAGPWGG